MTCSRSSSAIDEGTVGVSSRYMRRFLKSSSALATFGSIAVVPEVAYHKPMDDGQAQIRGKCRTNFRAEARSEARNLPLVIALGFLELLAGFRRKDHPHQLVPKMSSAGIPRTLPARYAAKRRSASSSQTDALHSAVPDPGQRSAGAQPRIQPSTDATVSSGAVSLGFRKLASEPSWSARDSQAAMQ